ncbi:MAG: 1-deoxy-D-xylulose-5-phosphate synthase [Prevotella sp.]|nr:1-deoxy-D-xylulose-5-phosphate synthase [Staphylococcus sp.]MCM1349771.1 1-deoxy-D-xylulose-5-phosphate synthase [Prevotella sp.]
MQQPTIQQIKQMNDEELQTLAQQIRTTIIETVSQNGGHLASNLGVVELTIALHKVFDSPKDKLIFDVSHQTYAHKIITGRLSAFPTLRKYKGLSGFSKYAESIHDAFEAGHSSTAISAGLGYLEAKKTYPEAIGEVIAIVGDASIANGLSFEALNYLGDHQDQKMIIIINDNAMGISKNVGSLARSYHRVRTRGKFTLLRHHLSIQTRSLLKSAIYDIGLFASLGFEYFEKIDGHCISELIQYLEYAKSTPHSIVLHVVTQKGKGYELAEEDQLGSWHGVEPFDVLTGKPQKIESGMSYGKLLSNQLITYVENQSYGSLIRVITPAMSLGSGLESFAQAYPHQFIDVGIAEENATLIAGAMAHAGLVPVLFIYATFLQRAYDELMHDIARSKEHVVICIDHAGIVSGDGDTHQGIFDLAYLDSIPHIQILAPRNAQQAIGMLEYAIEKSSGPVVIRYPKQIICPQYVPQPYQLDWETLVDDNTLIITYGRLVDEVATWIDEKELMVGLVNAHSIAPLDTNYIDKVVKQQKKVVVYEEVIPSGSLGNRILRYLNQSHQQLDIQMVCLPFEYLEVGTRKELMEQYHIALEDVKKAIGE